MGMLKTYRMLDISSIGHKKISLNLLYCQTENASKFCGILIYTPTIELFVISRLVITSGFFPLFLFMIV